MTRKERAKVTHDFIKQNGSHEHNFSMIYSKLNEEILLEKGFNNNPKTNSYLKNLLKTRDKQADRYLETRRSASKKECTQNFNDFVRAFGYDTIGINR